MTNGVRGHEYAKIKVGIAPHSFADIIFGLALSIGSLILVQTPVRAWQDVAWNVLLFGFSFLVIVITWYLFSRIITVLPDDASSALLLNLLLLFCVALEPYFFYLLMNQATQNLLSLTSIAYALDVGVMFVILAGSTSMALKQERAGIKGQRPKLHPIVLQRFRHTMIGEYVVGALFLVSIAPFCWVSTQIGHLRFVLWYSSFLVFFVSHMWTRRTESKMKKSMQQS